jgi:uncharacterized protein YllA (UPF0747 family)
MQRGEIAGVGQPWPTTPEQWQKQVRSARARVASTWLEALAPAFGETAGLPVLERAARDGVVVSTGQQAGLFGGPMLTLVKALSARALADSIEQSTGVPCATVFWAATDDADFAEAATVVVPGTGSPQRLTLSDAPPAGTPMSQAPIRNVSTLLDALATVAGSAGGAGIETLRRCYRDGESIGGAYVAFMREILAPYGIAVLDASHPALLAAGRPILDAALARSERIEKQLTAWNETLSGRGLRPQVESVPGLSLVFANEAGIKRRVPVNEASTIDGRTPLSPNVLLRPFVEAAILPTVAYAAGPGEIAYFAQLPPIATALEVERPVAVPRWSTTIVEPAIERILERYDVPIEALKDFEGLLNQLVRARTPADVMQPLTDLRSQIDQVATALTETGPKHRIDTKIIDGIRAQLSLRLDRGERRLIAALKRNEVEMRRDLGTARASLYPEGVRQERSLSFVPFVARYGKPLIEEMLGAARAHADRLTGAGSVVSAASQ